MEMSLIRGLKELNNNFLWNKAPKETGVTACVLSGVETLKWAINQKQKGVIRYLVVGPNIVNSPQDQGAILESEAIDKILVPSVWVKNFFENLSKKLLGRVEVWAAGVEDLGSMGDKNGPIIIYHKTGNTEFIKPVTDLLNKQKIKFELLEYGKFTHIKYFTILSIARAMIYLSDSESQGLALNEAWMANIPTLVYDRGFFKNADLFWKAEKISAPYMSSECGLFFHDLEELNSTLTKFLQSLESFNPRQYSLSNFTDKLCANKLLKILDV